MTAAAFEGSIACHYQFLAGNVIQPFTYLFHAISATATIMYSISPEKKFEMHLPNDLQLFTDSEFARNLADHKSYYCIIFVLLNVTIQCKVKKSTSIAGHKTNAETKGTYSGVCQLLAAPL